MSNQPIRKNIFFTDVHISNEAIEVAIANGADVVTPFELGMERARDEELIAFALEQGLVMVTVNRGDFDTYYYGLSGEMIEHPGLVIISEKRLKNHYHIGIMLTVFADEDMTNRVEWI